MLGIPLLAYDAMCQAGPGGSTSLHSGLARKMPLTLKSFHPGSHGHCTVGRHSSTELDERPSLEDKFTVPGRMARNR